MSLWEWIKVVILGVVEGITEFLPISSTGHLILMEDVLHLNGSPAFRDAFFVVIQLGAVLAVARLYGRRLWPFQKQKDKSIVWNRRILSLWGKAILACLPGAAAVLLLGEKADVLEQPWVVATALIGYGVIFLALDRGAKNPRVATAEDLRLRDALRIGLFQVLSLVPGTSRSGSTIIGGLLIGAERSAAAEFSFFLAIPVMAGYALLKLIQCGSHFTGQEWLMLLLGTLVSFCTALPVVRRLMDHLKKHGFAPFGWYRIALGAAVLIQIWIKGT